MIHWTRASRPRLCNALALAMYLKDLERLSRTLVRQRCDAEYIRYYLKETYQITDTIVDQVFETCGIGKDKKVSIVKKTQEMMGGKKVEKQKPGIDGKVKRSGFF